LKEKLFFQNGTESGISPVFKGISNTGLCGIMRTAFILAITFVVCMCSGGVSGTAKLGEGGENKPCSFCAGKGTPTPEKQRQADEQDYKEFERRFKRDVWGELQRMAKRAREALVLKIFLGNLERKQPLESHEQACCKSSLCTILDLRKDAGDDLIRRACNRVARSRPLILDPQTEQFWEIFRIMSDVGRFSPLLFQL
jgi:hypothetical protein